MSDDAKIPDDLAALFLAEREIVPADPALKARVLQGLEQSIGDLGGGEGGASGGEGGSIGGGTSSTGGAADVASGTALNTAAGVSSAVGSGVSLAQIAGISALTFMAGAGVGVVLDRSVRAPEVIEVPVEVPVERVVEVPVEVMVYPDAAVALTPTAPRVTTRRPGPAEGGASVLQREQRLIDSARAQIDRAPERALATLARYRRQFGQGLLSEEAAAIEVLALKNAGREDQAKRAAQVFVRSYPKSMFRRRVEEAVQ